ncbi:putative choline and nitrogen mustard permease [Bisporella sp. PMI_857]|nr:putative choline and nitrogen mustard permease [Bisporella sp. PMI_857]
MGNVDLEAKPGVHLTGTTVDLSTNDEAKTHFNLWSTLGMSYTVVGTPLTIGTYLAFGIGVGGSPVFFYGYIVATLFQIIICISLAEMAAVFPHSSGQVHWSTVLAPPRMARALGYWTGAFTTAAWFFWTIGTYLFNSQLLWATIIIANPDFVQHSYHVYLLYLATAIFAITLNVPLFKGFSFLLRTMAVFVNGGAVFVMAALLARTSEKRSASTVFVDFVDITGWDSKGFVFLLGLLPGITATNAFDSSTHLTDELPDPRKQVPQVMIGTSILGGLSGLPMVIVFLFCITNEENLFAPVGGQPIAQLFLDSIRSVPITLALMAVYVVVFFVGSASLTTTCSRVLWSLARERHLIMSPWLARTSSHELPANAIYFTAGVSSLVGLLCLGPTTALNAILGSAAICFFISYMIPISCLLANRQPLQKQRRYVNLGAAGPILNWISMAWMSLMSIVLLFPQYLPVASATMNYTSAVLGCVFILFGLNWVFYARKNYRS